MKHKILKISLALILLVFLVVAAAVAFLAYHLVDYDRNPISHIRNDKYMVGAYYQYFGFRADPAYYVVVVDLESSYKDEETVAFLSTRSASLKGMSFVDSVTIELVITVVDNHRAVGTDTVRIDLSGDYDVIDR